MIKPLIRKIIAAAMAAAVLTGICGISAMAGTTVEYSALRELLKTGNSTMDSLNKNLQNIEDQISILESSRFGISSLMDNARDSGDSVTAKNYENTNSMLYSAAGSLKKSLQSQTKAGSSYDSALSSLEKSAQTMMISYKSMEYSADAAKKSYDAAVAKYNTVLNKYVAGLASEADVNNASSSMESAKNMYEMYSQQASSLRYSFLQLLGIADDGTVSIGDIPAPDVNAIKSIDPESDISTYIGYDRNVINSRQTSNTKYYKEAALTESEGTAAAEYRDMYSQLQADLTEYSAAADAYAAAEKQYATSQRKHSLGMLTDTDMAAAEAEYASALASYKRSELALKQAYEDYCWTMKGF